ncbi:MAG TPA: nicotinate phosphoribosyltransferase [Thermohalobaculum sp.]|nr:nicotinate phosphoribosyltransferase [Thermohalobaculum sp.]
MTSSQDSVTQAPVRHGSVRHDFLLTDLYQLNMMQAYLEAGKTGTAVFEFFVRKLPEHRQFLMAAGLEQCLDFLETLRATPAELDWLASTGRFSRDFIDYLARMRFTGDVLAMPEGTVCFPDEPILRVTAPMPVAQYAETRLLNLLHFGTLIASKAARMVLAADGRALVDFGLRRAHGAEAGLLAARAAYLAGCTGTATVAAGRAFGVPIHGTMAHSFVETFDSEAEAFEAFAHARPEGLVLLIDTYDTEAGARKVVDLAPKLAEAGIEIEGVRLDSGDLEDLAHKVRAILDAGGLSGVSILASGGLDETAIARLVRAGAPIAGFGVGTGLTTSQDAPSLDSAYKLQEYDGIARRKKSSGKVTWPGRKQVWRCHDAEGVMDGDTLSTEGDRQDGEPLLRPVMQAGRRVGAQPTLEASRAHAAAELARLPRHMRRLEPGPDYPVRVADPLRRLAEEVDRRIERHQRRER